MSTDEGKTLDRRIVEDAAQWFVEFRGGELSVRQRRAFDAWLRASPQHIRAYLEIAALWGHAAGLDPQRRIAIDAEAVVAPADDNVVRLSAEFGPLPFHRTASPPPRLPGGRLGFGMAVAAAVLLVAGALGISPVLRHRQQDFTTVVGEQRSVRLSDGSTVTLNSRSRVRVEFSSAGRNVVLLEGEALFRVAKDPSWPFYVRAGAAVVRAVGTQFDVNRMTDGTIVTVVEGRVAVTSHAPAGTDAARPPSVRSPSQPARVPAEGRSDQTVFLSTGEQLDVGGSAALAPTRASGDSVTAWVQGKVILEAASLAQVAEEFNRYSERRLVAEDHGAVPLQLSGVFSTDPQFLISYLRTRPDIQVHESAARILIVRAPRH